jgi:uncharacterized membrane protein YciS (DUF1049 family)
MKKLLAIAVALGVALVSMLPGVAAAKIAINRNQTMLRVSKALAVVMTVGFAMTMFLPGIAAARIGLNHNQTSLRG